MPVRVIGGTIPTAFYTYTSVQNASAAAFTFSASTGTASTRKTIAVFVRVNGVISSVVINGVAIAPASTFGPSLYIAAAPTGTTATVTVNMSAVLAYTCTVTVFAVYDLASIVPLRPRQVYLLALARIRSWQSHRPGFLFLDLALPIESDDPSRPNLHHVTVLLRPHEPFCGPWRSPVASECHRV